VKLLLEGGSECHGKPYIKCVDVVFDRSNAMNGKVVIAEFFTFII
jgi:hypothetical protein